MSQHLLRLRHMTDPKRTERFAVSGCVLKTVNMVIKCSFVHQDIPGQACSKGKGCKHGHAQRSVQDTSESDVVSYIRSLLGQTHPSPDGIQGGELGNLIRLAFPTYTYATTLKSFMECIPDVHRTFHGRTVYYKLTNGDGKDGVASGRKGATPCEVQ